MVPLNVILDAFGSFDDGSIVSYEWDYGAVRRSLWKKRNRDRHGKRCNPYGEPNCDRVTKVICFFYTKRT